MWNTRRFLGRGKHWNGSNGHTTWGCGIDLTALRQGTVDALVNTILQRNHLCPSRRSQLLSYYRNFPIFHATPRLISVFRAPTLWLYPEILQSFLKKTSYLCYVWSDTNNQVNKIKERCYSTFLSAATDVPIQVTILSTLFPTLRKSHTLH